jgi:hypothetical protein
LAAAEPNEFKLWKDPLLEALVTARHVKERKRVARMQPRQGPRDDEWTMSLRRLATVAASTAKTVAHVMAPAWKDARDVVVTSTREFVRDVAKEYQVNTAMGDDDETVFGEDETTASFPTPMSTPRKSGGSGNSNDPLFSPMYLQRLQGTPSPTDMTWKRIPSKHRPRISSLDDVVEGMDEDDNLHTGPLMVPKLLSMHRERMELEVSNVLETLVSAVESRSKQDTAVDTRDLEKDVNDNSKTNPLPEAKMEGSTSEEPNAEENNPAGDGGSNDTAKPLLREADPVRTDAEQTIVTLGLTEDAARKEPQTEETMDLAHIPCSENAEEIETALLNDSSEAIQEEQEKVDTNDDNDDADVYDAFAKVDSELSMLCAEIMSDSGTVKTEEEAASPKVDKEEAKGHVATSLLATWGSETNDGNAVEVSHSKYDEKLFESSKEEEELKTTQLEGQSMLSEEIVKSSDNEDGEQNEKVTGVIAKETPDESAAKAAAGDGQVSNEASSDVDTGAVDEKHRSVVLNWISNPLGSATGGTNIVTGEENEANTSKVETLSTYDNAPPVFADATQAVRNYHANVQTLQSCETSEQREMCRVICNDTYKLACRLVAEKGQHLEHTDFQTRLLDDLRTIREMEKTVYAEDIVVDPDVPVSDPFENAAMSIAVVPRDRYLHQGSEPDETGQVEREVVSHEAEQEEWNDQGQCETSEAGEDAPEHLDDSIANLPSPSPNVNLSEEPVQITSRVRARSPARTARERNVDEPLTRGFFDGDGEAIYEKQTAASINALPHAPQNSDDSIIAPRKIGKWPGSSPFLQITFKDKKSAVKFLVTNLTGYDVEIKDKPFESHVNDLCYSNQGIISESVFDRHAKDDDSSSLSTSPGDFIREESSVEEDKQGRQSAEDDASLFDFMPSKHFLSVDNDSDTKLVPIKGPTKSRDRSEERALVRQFSNASLAASLESSSTRRSRSLSRSPRRRTPRRLRRQGGSRSGPSSRTPTPLIRSPQETPVEERSLVDGKPAELTIPDHEGDVVKWDNFLDTDEMSEALDRTGMLDEALMTFSSLENTKALLKVPLPRQKEKKKGTKLGTLIWRQLLANWKHSEVWKAMQMGSASESRQDSFDEPFDEEESSSDTNESLQERLVKNEVVLSRYFTGPSALLPYSNSLILARYLCDIGPRPTPFDTSSGDDINVGEVLRHHLCNDNSKKKEDEKKEKTSKITDDKKADNLFIEDIHSQAKERMTDLEKLLASIANYASQNCLQELDANKNSYSVNVKDYVAIRDKAERKYRGDVSQVKDILRGQITFADEGALICGIYSLYSLAGKQRPIGHPKIATFEIVRMKNLFRTTKTGREYFRPLPTGYRHILLNIRFEGGVLAGKFDPGLPYCDNYLEWRLQNVKYYRTPTAA